MVIKTVIGIKKFLSRFYNESVDPNKKYSHEFLKMIAKDLYEITDDEEEKNKDIIYVMDDYGKVCKYSRGSIILDDNNNIYASDVLESLSMTPTYALLELLDIYKDNYLVNKAIKHELKSRDLIVEGSGMDNILATLEEIPTYALHELLSLYKKHYSIYRKIKNELISRGEYTKKLYKLQKDVVKVEMDVSEIENLNFDFSLCIDGSKSCKRRLKVNSRPRVNRKGRWY